MSECERNEYKYDKKYEIEREVVPNRTNRKVKPTADELMKISGIRIPTELELAFEEFNDGIPGHITTNEEKVVQMKKEVEEYEKEVMSCKIQNEIYTDAVRELTYKISSNERKIEFREKRIKDLLSEINKLTSNV